MSTKNSDLQPLPAGLTYCRKCENTKPTELFVLSTLSKSKQKGVCKACWADYVKGRREARDLSKSISTADLSKDVIALHAFAGQIVAAVKGLSHVSPEAWNLARALEATHATLEANLACVRVDRLAKGLPPLPLPNPSAASVENGLQEGEAVALPNPSADKNEGLPGDSGASKIKGVPGSPYLADPWAAPTEDSFAQEKAEQDAEREAAEPVPLQNLPESTNGIEVLAEDLREANAQDLPTPETEIPLGANKVVTDLDPSKEEF